MLHAPRRCRNRLGDKGCAAVVSSVRHCASLRGLDLSSNGPLGEAPFLSEALVAPGLVDLRLATLWLNNNALGNRFGAALFGALAAAFAARAPPPAGALSAFTGAFDASGEDGGGGSGKKRTYSVDGSLLSAGGGAGGSGGNGGGLEDLGLDNNALQGSGPGGKELLAALKDMIAHNTSLRLLSLNFNKLGEAGGREIMKGLLLNASPGCLHVLNLKDNLLEVIRFCVIVFASSLSLSLLSHALFPLSVGRQ